MQTQKIQTSGKMFEAIRKRLKARNARFRKLGKGEQRVAIARDVIKQIRAEKFMADSRYFQFGFGSQWHGPQDTRIEVHGVSQANDEDLDLSECISQVSCSVCGIGSLFASAVLNADKFKVTEIGAGSGADARKKEAAYLERWFTGAQLNLVEVFYERWDSWTARSRGTVAAINDFDRAASPISKENDNNKRLIMIMQNIVSNKGKFDPFKGKHKIA